jgi:hypothetical protein
MKIHECVILAKLKMTWKIYTMSLIRVTNALFHEKLYAQIDACASTIFELCDLRHTTGKPSFAVRENLFRAFSIGRTAKNFFAVRFI